jgi:hypothetical protein
VVVRAPLGGDRDELERSRDRVIEGGEGLEGRVPLSLGHELQIDRGELEPSDESTADAKAIPAHAGERTGCCELACPLDLEPPTCRAAEVIGR